MELEEQVLEPTLDVETAPMMETSPAEAVFNTVPPGRYWQAQGLADMLQSEFERDLLSGNAHAMRDKFYLLANYYTRTLAILRQALDSRKEGLGQAALHNLITLHKTLDRLHNVAPDKIPSILSLNRNVRPHLMEDLIVRVVNNAAKPLDEATIRQEINHLDILADASEAIIRRHLSNLVSTGHLKLTDKGYLPSERPYSYLNLNQTGLELLLSPALYRQLSGGGYPGLSDIITRKSEFRNFWGDLGFSAAITALFTAVCEVMAASSGEEEKLSPWRHFDLIGSSYPRPYQYEAYAVFKGYGYHGQVIESPTGSGKTLIGMMCIQDWLRTLSQGQSILVLVPTVNYQQQWVGELCYKPTGLHLSPHLIFTGTPSSLEALRSRTAISPCILIMTYTALAQVGSGVGKGGFDQDSIEMFLQGNNVQYVIFDEVHKVVENLQSISANVTRLLTEWLHDGTFRGVIGFSGTAAAYRPRFGQLGLELVYIMPAAELIAYGFVAPFTEVGVPFAYSEREQRIRSLLDEYKLILRDFISLIGSANLRRWFAEIDLEERIAIGRDLLRMYTGNKDQAAALSQRFQTWEAGATKELSLSELSLITVLQIARGWSDEELVHRLAESEPAEVVSQKLERFGQMLENLNAIRAELKSLIYLPDTVRRLESPDFGTRFDYEAVRRLPSETSAVSVRIEQVKNYLASTISGLYDSLSDWYMRVGEGRVATIKAIIEAERAMRTVSGTIIFDAGVRIRWETGLAVPGYGGAAGVFSQMLGDTRFMPMAALSREIYLPFSEENSLPSQIADFIRREIILSEQGDGLFGLVTQGLNLTENQLQLLQTNLARLLAAFVEELKAVSGLPYIQDFNRKVIIPFRKIIRQSKVGKTAAILTARLSLRQYHIRNWLETFFDYLFIAGSFDRPHTSELQQVSGARQKFYIVPMPEGDRKQLMYDLTARIVDADTLPINMIIVSSWARTGWNVIKPNLLIDATATRNVTAWQQLRGRAMRARRSWTNECYRLVLLLMGSRPLGLAEDNTLPEDVLTLYEELKVKSENITRLDEASRAILREAHGTIHASNLINENRLVEKIDNGILEDFTAEERKQLVTELMLARNKVTHIYELVKAYGSSSQISYNRTTRQWERVESISLKHSREYAVSAFTGEYLAGEDHAPLIYLGDPRKDLPTELQVHLTEVMNRCDPRVVEGWLKALG